MNDKKMEKVVNILVDRQASVEELHGLCKQHPDLTRLLGEEYTVHRDKTGGYYVVDSSGDIDLEIGLFLAISHVHGL